MAVDHLPPSYQPLRAEYAYVVQLRKPAAHGAVSGRIEHMASGSAARFESAEELLKFLGQCPPPTAS